MGTVLPLLAPSGQHRASLEARLWGAPAPLEQARSLMSMSLDKIPPPPVSVQEPWILLLLASAALVSILTKKYEDAHQHVVVSAPHGSWGTVPPNS